MDAVVKALAILVLSLVLAVAAVASVPPLPPGPSELLSQEIDSWAPVYRTEMCEVWSQDRAAVVQRMQVLDYELTDGVIVAVVGQYCNTAKNV